MERPDPAISTQYVNVLVLAEDTAGLDPLQAWRHELRAANDVLLLAHGKVAFQPTLQTS